MSYKNENLNNEFLSEKEQIELYNDLAFFGYLLPTNEAESDEFEKIYGTTQTILPEKFENPNFLTKNQTRKSKNESSTSNDYFKKMVLAAEIVSELHNENTFGHKKFVKVLYLCEEVCSMNLSTNYSKHVAGPLDPKLLHSIDNFFKSRKWFELVRREKFGYKYMPLESFGEHKPYFENYFAHQKDKIYQLLFLLRKQKSDFCEIIATMYFVWNENLNSNNLINEKVLLRDFYDWDEAKKRFKEDELTSALSWMKEKGIYPNRY